MSNKTFNLIAGTLFIIVGILHFFRAINGWEMYIDTFQIPVWASWAAFALTVSLAYHYLRKI